MGAWEPCAQCLVPPARLRFLDRRGGSTSRTPTACPERPDADVVFRGRSTRASTQRDQEYERTPASAHHAVGIMEWIVPAAASRRFQGQSRVYIDLHHFTSAGTDARLTPRHLLATAQRRELRVTLGVPLPSRTHKEASMPVLFDAGYGEELFRTPVQDVPERERLSDQGLPQ